MKKSVSIFTVTLFTLCVMAVFIAGFSDTANAMSSSSAYVNTRLPKEQCMSEARSVLTNAKFSDISHGTYTMFGVRGSYSALIRSIPDKQIAFIAVIGPDQEECNRLVTFMQKNGIW
jgi:hypothetical protein